MKDLVADLWKWVSGGGLLFLRNVERVEVYTDDPSKPTPTVGASGQAGLGP